MLVASASAQSDAPVSVLMVRSSGDERLVDALRAELISYRYRVLEITPRAGDRGQALPALAQKYEVEAAVRVDATKNAVELWVQHRSDEEPDSDELVASPGPRPELLAVRVTETMRARGLRVPAPAAERSQPSAATNAAVAAAAGTVGAAAVTTTGVAAAATAATAKTETAAAAPAPDHPASELAHPAAEPATLPLKAAAPRPPAEATAPPPTKAAAPEKPPARPPAARLPPTAAEKPKPRVPPPSAAEVPAAPERANPSTASARVDTGAPAAGRALAPDHGALVYAEVGTSGAFSPGTPGLGPAFDLWLELRLQPYRTTSLSVFVLAPLLQTSIKDQENEGTGSVRTFLVGGSVDLHMPVATALELSFGLAAGALFSSITAQPIGDTPLVQHDVPVQRTAALLARAGASYRLVDQLHVTARAMAGVGVPELKINFGEREVATSGLPLIIATLGLELALPWQR